MVVSLGDIVLLMFLGYYVFKFLYWILPKIYLFFLQGVILFFSLIEKVPCDYWVYFMFFILFFIWVKLEIKKIKETL